jgi:hypothetical protein
MELQEFINKFNNLKDRGFVKSLRKGPTGIGKTLETYLGIEENNLYLPDLGEIELKAHRDGVDNLITLFTFNRWAWVMDPLQAIKKYGTRDDSGRLGLYFTMSFKPNSAGLFLHTDNGSVSVRHVDGTTLVKWNFKDLEEQFNRKIPALILAYAQTEYRGDEEWFHFYTAKLLTDTSASILKEQIINEVILIDLRLHDAITHARNHGTGFRVKEKDLPELFKKIEAIV